MQNNPYRSKEVVKYKATSAAEYRSAVRSAVRGMWSGSITYNDFFDMMYSAIDSGLRNAWLTGAARCGIKKDELNEAENQALRRVILNERSYIAGFADAILENSKENKGKLTPLLRRAELWVKRYNDVASQAQVMACSDKKLKWMRHALDSCSSCRKMEGRVYRASVWNKYGLRPRSPKLECMIGAKGVPVCRCEFMETDEKVTPGRPPNP